MDERYEFRERIKKEWRQVQSAKSKGFITDCARTPSSFFSAHRRSRELLRNAEQCTLATVQSFGAKTPSSKSFDAISGTAVKLCVKIPSLGQDVTKTRTEERSSIPNRRCVSPWSLADLVITTHALYRRPFNSEEELRRLLKSLSDSAVASTGILLLDDVLR